MATKIAEIVETAEGQVVRLPAEFRFQTASVSIQRQGQAIRRPGPTVFFEKIHIDDPAFRRPDQGEMPSAPALD